MTTTSRWQRKWERAHLTDGWSPIPTLRDGGGLPRDERGLRPLLRREPGRGVGGHGGHGAPAAGPVRLRRPDPSRGGAATVDLRAAVPRDGPALECRHRRHARHGRGLPGELHQGGVLDSDTAVAVISGIPSATDEQNILPPDKMVETREIVNRLAASRRIVSHGLISPNKGRRDLEDMERQAKELKVEAWKGYTGQPMGLTGVHGPWTTRRSRTRCSRRRAVSASRTSACTRACRSRGRSRRRGTRAT